MHVYKGDRPDFEFEFFLNFIFLHKNIHLVLLCVEMADFRKKTQKSQNTGP